MKTILLFRHHRINNHLRLKIDYYEIRKLSRSETGKCGFLS